MHYIEAGTTGHAWSLACAKVLEEGQPVCDGTQELTELLDVFVRVENPLVMDDVLLKHADQGMIEWMKANFLKPTPITGWGYSYGQRLADYAGIDQLQAVISKIRSNPETKSATASLMYPPGDLHHAPCVVALDFKVRSGWLRTTAFFRSQDAGKKLYADVIAIGEIASRVAEAVEVSAGFLQLVIVSLHVYGTDLACVRQMLGHSNDVVTVGCQGAW